MENNITNKVDEILNRNSGFWRDLETQCVSECCGIDAFDLSTKNIKSNLIKEEKNGLIENLEELISEMVKSETLIVSSCVMNASLKKEEFITLIQDILKK